MFLLYSGSRGMSVLSKQSSLSLPGVGAVSNFWDFSITTNGAASPLSDVTSTVKTVDSATQSYTRERASDGRIDGFTINQPRDGMRHRPAGSSPTSTGGTVNYSALLVMPLPGTGATVYSSVASTENFFGFAIDKP